MGYDTHTIATIGYKEEHEALVLMTWLQNQNDFDFDIEKKTLSFSFDSRNFRFDLDDIRDVIKGTLLEQLDLDWVEDGYAEVSGHTEDTWQNLYDEGWSLYRRWEGDPTKAEVLAWACESSDGEEFDWDIYNEFVAVYGDVGDEVGWDICRDDEGELFCYEGTPIDGYVESVEMLEKFILQWFQEEQNK